MHTSINRTGIDFHTPGLNLFANVRADFLLWITALVPPLLLMTVVAMQPWVDAADLLRDPLAVAELKGANCCKVYYGLVSNTGVVLWMACSAVCLFSAAVLAQSRGLAPETIAFTAAGLFTGFLGADDLFLVHENVLPAFGIPQPVTYGVYGLIACGYPGAVLAHHSQQQRPAFDGCHWTARHQRRHRLGCPL